MPISSVRSAKRCPRRQSSPVKAIDRRHSPANTPAPGDGAATDQQARVARTVRFQVLYGNRFSPDAIRMIVGLWKSLLFVPAVAIVFQWCRAIYGLRAGWLA